jgi:hypothetical protein
MGQVGVHPVGKRMEDRGVGLGAPDGARCDRVKGGRVDRASGRWPGTAEKLTVDTSLSYLKIPYDRMKALPWLSMT